MKKVQLNGQEHIVKTSVRIIGIIFDFKLNWYEHVMDAIISANKAKQAIRLISKYF